MSTNCMGPETAWTFSGHRGLVHAETGTSFLPAMQGSALTAPPASTTGPGQQAAKATPLLLLHETDQTSATAGAVRLWYPYTNTTDGKVSGSHKGAYLAHDQHGVAWSSAPDRSHTHGAASALFPDFSMQTLTDPGSFSPSAPISIVTKAQFATLAT